MCGAEETETHLYRRLWLNSEHELGQIAETLAEAIGWQPTDDQILPDALELAQVAAARLASLERAVAVYSPPLKARRGKEREYA